MSASASGVPRIRETFIALVDHHATVYPQQRIFQRMRMLAVGMILALARHTITQALLVCGCADVDWSPFYRLFSLGRVRITALHDLTIRLILADLPADHPLVVAVDAVHLPRESRTMPGTGWARAPGTAPFQRGLARTQRFGILQWLPALEHGWTRAIPLLCYPLFTPAAQPALHAPCREWEGALIALRTLRAALDRSGRPHHPILVLADGSYDVVEFWRALPPHTFVLARSARNRVLRHMPPLSGHQRGRRRLYGDRAPTPADWWNTRSGWRTTTQRIRGTARKLAYRQHGPYLRERAADTPLYLLIQRGQQYTVRGSRRHRLPVPLLINAQRDGDQWVLPYPVTALLVWAWQRWEVEVCHRDLKSGFGLGEIQAWNARATVESTQWMVWLYGIGVLAGYRTWGICGGPRPPGRWRRPDQIQRWSSTTLWRTLRAELWTQGAFCPRCSGTTPNPPKNPAYDVPITDMVRGSTRL